VSKVNIINDYGKKIIFNEKNIYKIINKIFLDQNSSFNKILVILSNKKLLNKLKEKYFKLNQYTDVIVFNLEDENCLIDGEIYISIDDVYENAIEYNQTFDDEFKRVVSHGILHLLGFEDNTVDKKNIMKKLEDKYIEEYKDQIIRINK
tara:strand:+ start:2425 stop:2871 length:447 start_codon:yes stop_codon:yes gene_type:complete